MRRRIELLVAAAVPAMPLNRLAAPTESPVATATRKGRCFARSVPFMPVSTPGAKSSSALPAKGTQEDRARVARRTGRWRAGRQLYGPLPPWSQKERWNAS